MVSELQWLERLRHVGRVRQTTPPVSRGLVLIDDEEDAHFLFRRLCARAELSQPLRTFRCGEDAVSYFEQCVAGKQLLPYVIFLDIRMHGMSGFDVLSWLRERELLGKTAVAMVSSSDDPKDVTRSFALGAHAYLGKSLSPEALSEFVRNAVRLMQ